MNEPIRITLGNTIITIETKLEKESDNAVRIKQEKKRVVREVIKGDRHHKKWTKTETQQLIQKYREGKTIKQLSQEFGRSKVAIRIYLGKLHRNKVNLQVEPA